MLIGSLGTNEIWIEIFAFSFKKTHLKIWSGKWQPFPLGHNVLNHTKETPQKHIENPGHLKQNSARKRLKTVEYELWSHTVEINSNAVHFQLTAVLYTSIFIFQMRQVTKYLALILHRDSAVLSVYWYESVREPGGQEHIILSLCGELCGPFLCHFRAAIWSLLLFGDLPLNCAVGKTARFPWSLQQT